MIFTLFNMEEKQRPISLEKMLRKYDKFIEEHGEIRRPFSTSKIEQSAKELIDLERKSMKTKIYSDAVKIQCAEKAWLYLYADGSTDGHPITSVEILASEQ